MALKIIRFLRLSDLFLVLWITFGVLLFLEQYRFIYYTSADLLVFSQPFFVFVIYFVLMVLSLVVYISLECKNSMARRGMILLLFFFIIVSQAENIFLSPDNIKIYILDIYSIPYTVSATYSIQVKLLHFFTIFFIVGTIFIGIFFVSKRFTSIKSISIGIYVSFCLAMAFSICSFIQDDYILLFKVLTFQETVPIIKDVCPKSVFTNQNAYGMFLEFFFFLAIINYYITKNKINIILTIFFYLELVLTLCKTGIVIATISVPLLFLLNALTSITNKKSVITNSILFIVSSLTIICAYIILKNSDNFSFLFHRVYSFAGRTDIWNSCYQLLMNNNSYLHGYGYGIYNSLVANSCGYYAIENCPLSHNWFLAMLGEGGLLYICCFISLLSYVTFIIVKNIKNDKKMAPLGCSIYGFFVHTFFEDNYYVVIGLIVLTITIHNINKQSAINKQ